jgi:hypothetical protein
MLRSHAHAADRTVGALAAGIVSGQLPANQPADPRRATPEQSGVARGTSTRALFGNLQQAIHAAPVKSHPAP